MNLSNIFAVKNKYLRLVMLELAFDITVKTGHLLQQGLCKPPNQISGKYIRILRELKIKVTACRRTLSFWFLSDKSEKRKSCTHKQNKKPHRLINLSVCTIQSYLDKLQYQMLKEFSSAESKLKKKKPHEGNFFVFLN